MHFAALSSLALFIASAVAQTSSGANPFKIPQGGYALTAGKASTITWTPTTSGPVTLTLRDGASSDLNKGTVIGQSISNSGSFTYTPPSDTVRNSDYTIEISSDSDSSAVNYTPQFVIESSNTVESQSSVSASATASASSASGSSAASSASASSAASSSASSASASGSSKSESSNSASKTSSSATASSTSGSSTTGSAAQAPSSGANVRNVINGGLAAAAFGAAIVL